MDASGISQPNHDDDDNNNNNNNKMKHSVHQIFQRRHEQELPPPLREVSPLLDHHPDPALGGTGVDGMMGGHDSTSRSTGATASYQDAEHGLWPSTKFRAKGHWKKIRCHVLQGDVLLSSIVQPEQQQQQQQQQPGSSRKDRIQRKIEEIRSGTEFRLWHGLVCIAIYLSLSVAFYNHILEPDWTMLDSMYFAIVTVTTVGYGDEYPTSNVVSGGGTT